MWEEDAMWQQKEISNHMREVTQKRVIGHAHMDSDEETMQRKYNGREGNREGERSTFWMRKLQEAEEQDPNRSVYYDQGSIKVTAHSFLWLYQYIGCQQPVLLNQQIPLICLSHAA